jgi:ABC-type lipoprotein export system ATPase subunit
MIELSHIFKSYVRHQNSSVVALRDISFKVQTAEFLAIRGPSGSGKSTLLNILGCLDVSTSGSYRLAGEDVSHYKDRELSRVRARRIGFIFQSFNLLPATTARENVELPMVYGASRVDRKKALALLARVGLQDRATHFASELSGGQQQRVAIARALVNDPPLLLADEPTGNLDSAASDEIMTILQELQREGRTIVMVTHDDVVASYAAREITLRDGEISADFLRAATQAHTALAPQVTTVPEASHAPRP